MVDKITIFEPHFDGAQFGPSSMARPETTTSDDTTTSAESAGGRRLAGMLALVGTVVSLVAVAAVVYRRRDSHDIEIEEIEPEAATVEH